MVQTALSSTLNAFSSKHETMPLSGLLTSLQSATVSFFVCIISGAGKQWPVCQIWGPLPRFINKLLLEHSHANLCVVCGCFHVTKAELYSCDRDFVTHKTQNICCL